MYGDDESHSESKFYSPEEMGNTEIYNEGEFFNPESNKENNGVVNENNIKHENLDDIQHFVEAQRPEKTTKKTITTSVFGTGTVKRSTKVKRNTCK